MKSQKNFRRCRKAMSFLIGLSLAVSLGACGTPGSTSPASSDSGSASGGDSGSTEISYNGTSPVFDQPKTITMLTTNGGSKRNDFQEMAWCQEIVKRANVDLKIEVVDSSSYDDVVKPRLAAATDLPDLIKISGNDSDMSYINSGIFLDLTDYYDKYGYNLNAQFEENPRLKAEITTPDGKIFYIPYMYLTVDWCRCIMVNQPWLEELGIQHPKTMDEYYNLLKAIKSADLNHNGENDEIPLFMRAGMTQLFGTLWDLDLLVGYKADDDGTVTCSYTQPAYKDFLTYFNKLYTEGLLYSEFATANLDTQNALFHNNQVGTILHFMSNCTGYSSQINPDWDFDNDAPVMQPILPPSGPNGDAYYYGRDGLGSMYGITRDCKDPESVFCFVDYLYSKEATELAWYGFEGIDYNLVDGDIEFTSVYLENKDNYLGQMGYNCDALPGVQIPGSYGATQCKAIMDANSIIREHAKNPIGFSFNLPGEVETVQAYKADLETYFSEMFVAFITGTTPLTEWDNYLTNVKAMHVDDMAAVFQAINDRQTEAAE